MSRNIGRELRSLAEIKQVLMKEDIGICSMIETDDTQRNLQEWNRENPKDDPEQAIYQ